MKWRDNAVSIFHCKLHIQHLKQIAKYTSFSLFTLCKGFFQAQLEQSNIPYQGIEPDTHHSSARTAQEIDDLEETLKDHEVRISQMNSSYETLLRRNLQLTELRHVLKESSVFFEQASVFWDV